MADLICCGLGNHDCSDGHSWGVGVRTEYIFHYIDKGCGYLECDGERHTVGEGQIFVIFPDTPVKYYPNPENTFFYRWVDLRGSLVQPLIEQTFLTRKTPVTPSISEMRELFLSAKLSENEQINGSVLELLGRLIKLCPNNQQKVETDRADRIAQYIRNSLHRQSLNTQSVADYIGLSRTQLYRIMKESFGLSPTEFIERERMDRALKLLKSGRISVKATAYSVGFHDSLYFSRIFRKHYGVPPREHEKISLD